MKTVFKPTEFQINGKETNAQPFVELNLSWYERHVLRQNLKKIKQNVYKCTAIYVFAVQR